MGGTEILEPLQEVYSWGVGELPKTIFLITDGAVSNPEAVVKLIGENQEGMGIRVHTFGIGAGVSTDLVMNAAEAGRGTYSFVQENESVDDKVVNAMELALQPYLTNLKIEWKMRNKEGLEFGLESSNLLQSPKFIKYILNKEITFIYGLIMDESFESGKMKIEYEQEGIEQKVEVQIKSEEALEKEAISKLAVKNLIKELEKKKEENKEMIIYLSKKFGVLSGLTSFIAIQEVYNSVNQTMERRNIPIAVTDDYGYANDNYYYGGPSSAQPYYSQPIFDNNSVTYDESTYPEYDYAADNQNDQASTDESEQTSTDQPVEEKEQKPSKESKDDYLSLIQNQRADGSFELNEELALMLGYQLQEVIDQLPECIESYNQKEDIWATTLVLAKLELNFKSLESSWRLVAKKGKEWIISQGLTQDEIKQLCNYSKDFLNKVI